MTRLTVETLLSDADYARIMAGITELFSRLTDTRPELVDGDTMASIASLSPATIDRLRRAEKIPSVKVGNRRLYRPSSVIAALEAKS